MLYVYSVGVWGIEVCEGKMQRYEECDRTFKSRL